MKKRYSEEQIIGFLREADGVGMICLKLRQDGLLVNHKRVERLYRLARLQVRRRKRKKVLIGERRPLARPSAAN